MEGHFNKINKVVFSPDSQKIASASCDKTILLWDAQTRASKGSLKGHSSEVIDVVFSPSDSQLIASASYDNSVRIWDTQAQVV
jgi:WD40 repeat protein